MARAAPERTERRGEDPVLAGDSIDVATLEGRIVFDDFEDLYSMNADGTDLLRVTTEAGAEFDAAWSPNEVRQLTDAPGSDGWPAWSPDGRLIAFKSDRDDCLHAADTEDCWRTDEPGEHHDIWLMETDGSGQRRVSPEFGQFVTWSPDGEHLLISGRTLYVVRPDGTGRAEIRPEGLPHASGGIPDWVAPHAPKG